MSSAIAPIPSWYGPRTSSRSTSLVYAVVYSTSNVSLMAISAASASSGKWARTISRVLIQVASQLAMVAF
jgi:hypothetical protein